MKVPPVAATVGPVQADPVRALTDELAATAALALASPDLPEIAAPPPQAARVTPVLDAVRAVAAERQGGLAPLLADLAQAVASPAISAALKAAIGQVLSLSTPLEGPMTAQAIAQAVARSGLFLEARLAAMEGEPPPDLKAALLKLQAVLRAAGPPAQAAARPPPPRTPPPAPPARGAALSGQAAALSDLPADADAATIAETLTHGVDQALARQTLHQLASLPDGSANAWMFEAPFATPQGPTVAQFAIERDARGPAGADEAAPWRVRLSIDIEPLGPVHVHLSAGGERTLVTVWAERPEGLQRLRREGLALAQALPAEVRFQAGAPQAAVPTAGHFVDRSS